MLATKGAELWQASWPVLVFPVACIAILGAATGGRGLSTAGVHGQAYRRGMTMTLGVLALFVAAIGYYVWRLSWMLVPPLLVIVTLQLQALRRTRPALDGWPGIVACIVSIVVWIAVLLARQGPYS